MIGSKFRSGSSDFGRKNRKTSRFCRGDSLISQIDTNALKPIEKKPSNTASFTLLQEQIVEISRMQQHVGQIGEELQTMKEELNVARDERDRALDELRSMKIVALEANTKPNEALSSPMVEEVLQMQEKEVESSKHELKIAKEFEAGRDTTLYERLKEELDSAKESEFRAMKMLSESKSRIEELDDELGRVKLSESRMYDTVVSQTKQLEETKIELEEYKLEIASLCEKMVKLEERNGRDFDCTHNHEKVDGEQVSSLRAKEILEEMNSLKSKLKLATEAEERSNKAMEDLALALKEVATEANQAKEELISTTEELEHVKEEAEQLKQIVRTIEDRYQKMLDDANKEMERYNNTIDRLRLEAEESLLAWNDKEMGFVSCIKKAEEEKAQAQKENIRLIESLKEAEKSTKTSREENFKLRDILKQALNEANVAKEAASIARIENSQLKDSHSEKDEALEYLAEENERLRVSAKEMNRLLSVPSKKALKTEEKEQEKIFNPTNSVTQKDENDHKMNKDIGFKLSELKIQNGHKDANEKVVHEDPIKAEALKGSIFDNVDSPTSERNTPRHRRVPSPFKDNGEKINLEDVNHIEDSDLCEGGNDRYSQRKGRALMRRFGDLMKRKGLPRKEASVE